MQYPLLDVVIPALDHLVAEVARERDPASSVGRDEKNGVLVALSGGPDSVALLRAADVWSRGGDGTRTRARTRPVAAAHLNHLLRGADADADAEFCRALCRELDVPLHTRRADPRPVANRRGQGLEEAGRVLRQRFFADVLAAHPELICVATGHHRDDQVETVVMRLFRGTGSDGLAGLRPRAGTVIHPLLGVDRRGVLDFLAQLGQPYRQDATNATGEATRTRVRRELLPVARSIFGPAADLTPARHAELAAAESAYLDRAAAAVAAEVVTPRGLHVERLLALDPVLARRVLRRTFGTIDLERRHVADLLAWLRRSQSGQQLDLPGRVRALRDFDHVRLEAAGGGDTALSASENYRILVAAAAVAEMPGTESGEATLSAPPRRTADGWELTVPAAALSGALRIRNWRSGDRIAAFGLDGHKKISDLLRERRVPRDQRSGIMVVEDDAGLLWVPDVVQAERTRLLPSTREAVTIRIVPRHPAPAPDGAAGRSADDDATPPQSRARSQRGKDPASR